MVNAWQDGTRLEKCEPHVQEAFRAFSQNWVVVTRQNTTYTKAQPTGTPATIYDLPKETFECETTATPEPAEQEDELLLGSIPHPNAQVLALNAQKRVSALPIAVVLPAPNVCEPTGGRRAVVGVCSVRGSCLCFGTTTPSTSGQTTSVSCASVSHRRFPISNPSSSS
jgi:hypothetical protein